MRRKALLSVAHASLHDANYDTLKHRLESVHSAVEAAAVEAKGGGYGSTRVVRPGPMSGRLGILDRGQVGSWLRTSEKTSSSRQLGE